MFQVTNFTIKLTIISIFSSSTVFHMTIFGLPLKNKKKKKLRTVWFHKLFCSLFFLRLFCCSTCLQSIFGGASESDAENETRKARKTLGKLPPFVAAFRRLYHFYRSWDESLRLL